MLHSLNVRLNRLMPLITPISIIVGVFCGSSLSSFTYLSPWLFAFMTFAGSISLGFRDFLNVLKKPAPLIICLFILHLVPCRSLLWPSYHLAFPGDAYTITGLILVPAIPTGVSSFVWVSIYKGNIALTLSIILIDTILAPFAVPGVLSLLIGASVKLDAAVHDGQPVLDDRRPLAAGHDPQRMDQRHRRPALEPAAEPALQADDGYSGSH